MIDDFANSWHLTNWDWLAFAIAILSFIIANVSLIVAVKTLRSQKKTEENTTPIMRPEIQRFLFGELFVKLFDGYMGLKALSYSLAKNHYGAWLPGGELMDFVLRVEDVHCDLYYDDQDNYRRLQGFREKMETYNRRLMSFSQNLGNQSISARFLERELSDLLDLNMGMADRWRMLASLIYGYTANDIYGMTADYTKDMDAGIVSSGQLLFDKDDFYVQSFSQVSARELLCVFMTRYTREQIAGVDESLLPLLREQ